MMPPPQFSVSPGFGPYGPVLPVAGPPSAMAARHPGFYPPPIFYWGYPSPPVSPTSYYGGLQPPMQTQPALLPADCLAMGPSQLPLMQAEAYQEHDKIPRGHFPPLHPQNRYIIVRRQLLIDKN